MQTIYYETSSFIRHQGNVVDLGAYRQRLAAVSGETWTVSQPVEAPAAEAEEAAPVLTLVPPVSPAVQRERRRRKHVRRFGMFLDFAASAAIVVFTLTAVVSFLRL